MKTKGHEFMRNERLGYMCTCPTNLGTVVRCSAHIQLKVRQNYVKVRENYVKLTLCANFSLFVF